MTQHVIKSSAPRAFTLIELLTVIAIIAVLAAIGVGLTGAAKTARINARAQGELQQLVTAIEAYKGDRGSYPPDNRLTPAGTPKQKVNPVVNPLYYELRGMEIRNGKFHPRGMEESLNPDDIKAVFGRSGFLNTSVEGGDPSKAYLDPKQASVKRVTIDSVQVDLLVSPLDWPGAVAGPSGKQEAAPISGSRVILGDMFRLRPPTTTVGSTFGSMSTRQRQAKASLQKLVVPMNPHRHAIQEARPVPVPVRWYDRGWSISVEAEPTDGNLPKPPARSVRAQRPPPAPRLGQGSRSRRIPVAFRGRFSQPSRALRHRR